MEEGGRVAVEAVAVDALAGQGQAGEEAVEHGGPIDFEGGRAEGRDVMRRDPPTVRGAGSAWRGETEGSQRPNL
ncbi:hypothetical protein MAFF212519_12980 [Clavibacter michiganensis]